MDCQALQSNIRHRRRSEGPVRPIGVPSWYDWGDDEGELELPDLDDDEDVQEQLNWPQRGRSGLNAPSARPIFPGSYFPELHR